MPNDSVNVLAVVGSLHRNSVTRQVTLDPNAYLPEPLPCDDIDRLHTTAHVRSG